MTMTAPAREIRLRLPYRLHASQRHVLAGQRRFNVVCCGRRWGKTTLGLDRAIDRALRGEPVAWFSPTYRMLAQTWQVAREVLAPLTARASSQQHRLDLVTGGIIEMWSLDNPDAARGRGYALAVIDEAALVPSLVHTWQAVIRPTLTDFAGAAWFLSTPRGLNGFYTLYQLGQQDADWASWRLPTSANPHIPPEEIEAARRALSAQAFAQEFLAEFIADGASVFRRVHDAATAEPRDAPVPGHTYLVSVDWGKHRDFTVIIVWDATERAMVALDRFHQIDYQLQLARLQAACERWRPAALVVERNSMGEPLLEQIERASWAPPVQPFLTTNATKAAAVEAFALALEQGEVRILPDPALVGELMAFTAERLPSGLLRYAAPAGMHDDCVMAAVIGWQAIGVASGEVFTWMEGESEDQGWE